MQLVEQDYFYERKELEEYVQHVGIHPDTRENVSESDIRGVQVPEHPPGLLEIESDFLWEHPVHYPSYQKVRQFIIVMRRVSKYERICPSCLCILEIGIQAYGICGIIFVVSIVFSPICTVELTTNWYQLHNGDYKGILEHSFGKQLPYKLSAITFGHL